MKDLDNFRLCDWYNRKIANINRSDKAGFVHDDAKLTNPLKINISPETLKLLKERLNNGFIK